MLLKLVIPVGLSNQHFNSIRMQARRKVCLYFYFEMFGDIKKNTYICNHEEYSNALDGLAVRPAADELRQAGR
jgi:hypothetical protein